MKLLSKISVKTVCGNVKELPNENLMRVIGIAKGTFTGTTNFGEYVGFKGQFKAINLATGEEFSSGKLFLPEIAQNLVEGALSETESVEFAFDLGKKEADNAVGYEYTIQPLIEAKENNPLALLEQKLS